MRRSRPERNLHSNPQIGFPLLLLLLPLLLPLLLLLPLILTQVGLLEAILFRLPDPIG